MEVLGIPVQLVSPEDSILSKLEWSRASRSAVQRRDLLGVARAQGDRLDRGYLEHWARELGLLDELTSLLAEVDGPSPLAGG